VLSTEERLPKSRPGSVATSTRKPVERTFISEGRVHLSLEAARCLGGTATMEGLDRGQIVQELIRTHLRKYVVQVRSDRTPDEPETVEGAAA